MIRIFNTKTGNEIIIDDSFPQIFLSPNDWQEENPHILIKLETINFGHHTHTCNDCLAFKNAFGTNTTDWYIQYLDKIKRLNLSTLGNGPTENKIEFKNSYYWHGTILKLNIDTDTVDSLSQELKTQEELENYEGCVILRNKINSIKN